MIAPFSCVITVAVKCAACGEEDSCRRHVQGGNQVPVPELPYRWCCLEGKAYCGKHRLTLDAAGHVTSQTLLEFNHG